MSPPVPPSSLGQSIEGELPRFSGRDSEEFLRLVLTAAPVYIMGISADLRVRFINRIAPGLTAETTIGRDLFDFIDADYRDTARACIERVLATGEPDTYETRTTRSNGQSTYYQVQAAPTRDPAGDTVMLLVASDISLLRHRETALAESQEHLRLAIEATGMALWSWDLRSAQPQWSPQMHELTGSAEPVRGEDYVTRLVHPDDRERVRADMAQGRATATFTSKPHRLVRPDGSVRWVLTVGRYFRDEAGVPVRVMGGCLDITHQRGLEEQLLHAQKMEAVGQLAAGVAHNFNNMLAAILPVLGMARSYMPPSRVTLIDEALHAGTRGAEMVQQLLAFAHSRRSSEPQTPHAIESCVRRALGICEPVFERRIVLTAHLPDAETLVECDPGQIEQAIVNVLLNARDELLEAGVREPRIEIEVAAASPQEVGLIDGAEGRPCVRVRVRDNGRGMSNEVRARVFEPFFSTKGPGRGTGLGLATAFATLAEYGGLLRCSNTGPHGTTFDLLLPVSAAAAPSESTEGQAAPEAHGGKLLVVDDEPGVREVTALVLEDAGYLVLRAGDAGEALELAARHPDLRLVLLDLSLQQVSGLSLLGPLRKALPKAHLVGFTGSLPDDDVQAQFDAIVLKPVRAERLLLEIAGLLVR